MPKKDGTLTEEEQSTLQKFVLEKWTEERKCPLCGKYNWLSSDMVVSTPGVGEGGTMIFGGTQVPSIPIICTFCGYTVFINAMIAGVIKPAKKKEESCG